MAVDGTGNQLQLRQLRDIPQVTSVLSITPDQTDRLDLLAFRYYRDPLLFWVLCDGSPEMDPFDVVAPGVPMAVPVRK
jgi:hypothetical protein